MPTPKQMIWIVALAGGVYFALEHYKGKTASGGSGSRYGV